jgi:hypothetical protein
MTCCQHLPRVRRFLFAPIHCRKLGRCRPLECVSNRCIGPVEQLEHSADGIGGMKAEIKLQIVCIVGQDDRYAIVDVVGNKNVIGVCDDGAGLDVSAVLVLERI